MISPETLRRYPFFAGLGEHTLKQIAMLTEEEEVEAGEWLFREGDEARLLYLVLDGAVTLTLRLVEGDENVAEVSTLGMGELVGWSSLVAPHTYKLGAQVIQKTKVISFDADSLRGLLDENPVVGYQMMQNLSKVMGERLINLRIQLISMVAV
jgi:CRP-like cAMP-binding protein